ncbi:hypothetical protein [Massilia sp. Root351]|uniref:hypothetical protein n=1 Tax=Massilia sp. Root351 TaxID=1736522 RepID=UPI0012F66AAF|nr:hypothetical protein [Massilia sp. Root351]
MTSGSPATKFARVGILALLACVACSTMSTAVAGTSSKELMECMVSNASPAERFDTALVTWVAASYHPSMPPELRVPEQSKELIYRRVGKLLDRLLLEVCTDKARATIRTEGTTGLAAALHAFWASGTVELNQSKEATSVFGEIWGYADGKKISGALQGK